MRRPARSPHPPLLLALALLGGCGDDEGAPERSRAAAERAPSAFEAAAARTERAGAGPLVVFLGDSLTAGLHVDQDRAFPALLQERLAADGLPFRLVNAGVSGDTSSGGRSRLDWLLRQDPDLVVVELGGNDGLRGTPLDTIEANLDAIVERTLAAGARVLLVGMRLPPNYGPEYTAGFHALFGRVAERHDVPFLPFLLDGVGGVEELMEPDGLHPNAEGHRVAAENLLPVLRPLVAALSEERAD